MTTTATTNRRIALRLFVLLSLLCLAPACRVQCSTATRLWTDDELHAGLENPVVLSTGDGGATLGIVVHPPDRSAQRSAVSLALVIDNSGSMGGEKIANARAASRAAVDALFDGDEISLVTFSSAAQLVVPLTAVDTAARQRVRVAIEKIEPETSTAILDGMQLGLRSLAAAHGASRRLLLISDGQANVGPTTAGEIVAGIGALPPALSLSTIGVGTDYDEGVLTSIAQHGAGGFHHLNDPVQLTQILEDELRQAHAVVGTNAVIEVTPRPGVVVLQGSLLAVERLPGGIVRIQLGELYAGIRRTASLSIKVPLAGAATGDEKLAAVSVRLRYQPIERGQALRMTEVGVRYNLTTSAAEVARGAVPEFMVPADRTRVAHALTDAAALVREGDIIEAQTILRDERTRLSQRLGKLAGRDHTDAESLIAMLRDPYVDANLAGATEAPKPAPASPAAVPNTAGLDALVQTAQQGLRLPEDALAALPAQALRLLRNAPYARHGYPFKSADLTAAFSAYGWYHPDAAFDERRMTPVDADNIALVHSYEGRASLMSARPAGLPADPAGAQRDFDATVAKVENGRPIIAAELRGLDLRQLRLLRNTLYARHGYVFRAADLQAIFRGKPWYQADPGAGPVEARLTDRDRDQIRIIQGQERQLLATVNGEALRDFELRSRARAWQVLR